MLLLFLFTASLIQEPAQSAAPVSAARQDAILVAEEVFQATVVSIEDGDTLVVRTLANAESTRVHIAAVDAPEMSQPGGPEAKAFLTNLISGKTITVRLKGTLEPLARVEVDGADLGLLLIKNGMAWHCPRFAKESGLAAAEAEARGAKRGFWNRPQPTPPWIYRGAGVCWEQKAPAKKSQRRPDFSGSWTAISPPRSRDLFPSPDRGVRQLGRALSIVSR